MKSICANVMMCPIYAYCDRNQMREMMQDFCLGVPEHCQRKQLRDSDQPVPLELLPDGSYLTHEEAATIEVPKTFHTVL